MTVYNLLINGQQHQVDVPDTMPLLYILREILGITGPKYGCGVGVCGACTSHVGTNNAERPCIFPVQDVQGKAITTIEGLAPSEDVLHPVQEAWIDHDVAQCGYCQQGQIMTAVAFLEKYEGDLNSVSDAEIDTAMGENVCRCGTYVRIRAAIKAAAAAMAGGS